MGYNFHPSIGDLHCFAYANQSGHFLFATRPLSPIGNPSPVGHRICDICYAFDGESF
jgi:hypothetical protein